MNGPSVIAFTGGIKDLSIGDVVAAHRHTDVKTSVRNLTSPLADMAAFQALVTDILTHNPWGCVDYVTGGQTIAGVVRGT